METGEGLKTKLRKARKESKDSIEVAQIEEQTRLEHEALKGGERIKDRVWRTYGDSDRSYDASFVDILDHFELDSFRQYLLRRKEQGKSTNVLDLMGGDGNFLRSLTGNEFLPRVIDAGLVVSLVDGRSQEIKKIDSDDNLDVLEGDITLNKTWRHISKWQSENGVKIFDLIICRGEDGVNNISDSLFPFVFARIWQRLNSDNGLFASQLPRNTFDEKDLVKQLSHLGEVDFVFHDQDDYAGLKPTVAILRQQQQ